MPALGQAACHVLGAQRDTKRLGDCRGLHLNGLPASALPPQPILKRTANLSLRTSKAGLAIPLHRALPRPLYRPSCHPEGPACPAPSSPSAFCLLPWSHSHSSGCQPGLITPPPTSHVPHPTRCLFTFFPQGAYSPLPHVLQVFFLCSF